MKFLVKLDSGDSVTVDADHFVFEKDGNSHWITFYDEEEQARFSEARVVYIKEEPSAPS